MAHRLMARAWEDCGNKIPPAFSAAAPGATTQTGCARQYRGRDQSRRPERLCRFSCFQDAYPLNLYLFISGSGAEPQAIFLECIGLESQRKYEPGAADWACP